MTVKESRYQGKPLLRLLELYVIWVVGQLSSDDAARLNAMAPKLQATLGGDGTWQGAIVASMHLTPEMPAQIREMWEKNQYIATQNDTVLTPQHFAEMFVDSNWMP